MPDTKDQPLSFLYASINDIQSTIRAVDFKVSVLMLVLVVPFTQLAAIYSTIHTLFTTLNGDARGVAAIVVMLFGLCWVLSLAASARAIAAIDDPRRHIQGDRPEGTFYSGGMFTVGFVDSLFNRRLLSKHPLEGHLSHLPVEEDAIAKELTFEQMKLVYIRTVKLERQKWAFRFCALWLVLGAVIWVWKLIVIS